MAPFWVRDEHLEREADFPELRGNPRISRASAFTIWVLSDRTSAMAT
jgi:hypothetical protein